MKKILLYIVTFMFAVIVISCGSDNSDSGDIQVTMSVMPLLIDADAHGKGVGWERKDCLSCHPTPEPSSHPIQVNLLGFTSEEVCMSCHLGNGVDKRFKIPLCVECHTSDAFANPVHATGLSAHTVSNSAATTMTNLDCVICHDSTNMNGSMDYNDISPLNLWDKSNINNFCFTCHSGNGTIAQGRAIKASDVEDKYIDDYHGGRVYQGTNDTLRQGNTVDMDFSCLTCHRQHSSTNRSLFIQSGAETGVVSEIAPQNAIIKLTNSNKYDLRDLCAVCHGEDTNVESTPAPNNLKQVVHKYYCYTCHSEGSMRPPSVISLGRDIADNMMQDGQACIACHTHGGNQGPQDYSFPKGYIHSRF